MTEPAHSKLRELISAGWMTQAIYVATELDIAGLLAQGSRSIDDLAQATGVEASRLRRLLNALCSLDVCRCESPDVFALTEMGALLGRDAPDSLHHWAKWFGSRAWSSWGQLLYSVQTGKSARQRLLGTAGFDHLKNDPEVAELFHRAMVELTHLVAADVAASYDFSQVDCVMDIGGGHGELLAAVLERNPRVRGIVFEQDHALPGARSYLEAHGLTERTELRTGDFFDVIPSGADAYLMKSILHDWNDRDAARILLNCRRALEPKARLLIVEHLMPETLEPSDAHRALAANDLHMMVALGAAERTQAQFAELFTANGLALERVWASPTTFSILEVKRAD
jgi:hypothetical protein